MQLTTRIHAQAITIFTNPHSRRLHHINHLRRRLADFVMCCVMMFFRHVLKLRNRMATNTRMCKSHHMHITINLINIRWHMLLLNWRYFCNFNILLNAYWMCSNWNRPRAARVLRAQSVTWVEAGGEEPPRPRCPFKNKAHQSHFDCSVERTFFKC